MKSSKDEWLILGFRLFCFGFVLLGVYLWSNSPDGSPAKAVGIGVGIVGLLLALIGRFMRSGPPY